MAQTQVAIAGLRSAQFAGGQVRVARGYDAWFDAGWGRYAWRAESAGVLAASGPVAGRTVTEVGSGTGRLPRLLVSRGAMVLGVDADPTMLTQAACRVPRRLVRGDAAHLPVLDASVDAAVAVATCAATPPTCRCSTLRWMPRTRWPRWSSPPARPGC